MRKIRILVVDDAVVVRKLLTDVLSEDPEIEIAGIAANGNIALAKIPQVNPDLITLDVEMPELNGLETLVEIRKTYPKLPVIMFSTLTERGANATLEALALGATDYVTKPANVGSVSMAMQKIREELTPKIKLFCGSVLSPPPLKAIQTIVPKPPPSFKTAGGLPFPTAKPLAGAECVDIVAIGISTGGPNALAEMIPALPGNFPVPIVIVQHMPEYFTKLLAQRLDSKSALQVHEGQPGDILQPGHAWLAPGNYHMVLEQKGKGVQVQTNQDPPENSCRPAVDVLFRSVVKIYGNRMLGVIMTGMGHDGLLGCQHVRGAGGQVVIQDEPTSVVWGMPGFVAKAGLQDKVLPLDQLAPELVRRVKQGRPSYKPSV